MQKNLKVAIVTSGHSQRRIATRSGIPENRLSSIVNGWQEAREPERKALARVLGRPESELFENVSSSEAAETQEPLPIQPTTAA